MCKDRIIVLLYLLSRLAYGGMGEMLAFLSVMHVILQCAMMYAGHTCREYVSCLAGILSYPLYETGNLQITIEVIPRIQEIPTNLNLLELRWIMKQSDLLLHSNWLSVPALGKFAVQCPLPREKLLFNVHSCMTNRISYSCLNIYMRSLFAADS